MEYRVQTFCDVDNSIKGVCVTTRRFTESSGKKIGALGENSGFRFFRAASDASKAMMRSSRLKPSTSAQLGCSADGVTTTIWGKFGRVIQPPSGSRAKPTFRSTEVRTASRKAFGPPEIRKRAARTTPAPPL